jgi:hypothetical protein
MSFFRTANHAREVEAEEREQRRLAHLFQSRTARFERMLDPRSHIGSDPVALEQQQRVKQLRAEAALAEKAAERQAAAATADAVAQLEREGEAARRARAAATAAALDAQTAGRAARSTWDLNDPTALRRAAPTRQGLDDPRLGLSSAQVFVGEDVAARQRALLQQAQVRTWTAQMVGEKEARRAADRAQDEAIAAGMVRCAALAGEIEAAGVAEQRQRQRSAALENEALMAEKRAQREREREESRVRGGWGWHARHARHARTHGTHARTAQPLLHPHSLTHLPCPPPRTNFHCRPRACWTLPRCPLGVAWGCWQRRQRTACWRGARATVQTTSVAFPLPPRRAQPLPWRRWPRRWRRAARGWQRSALRTLLQRGARRRSCALRGCASARWRRRARLPGGPLPQC